MSKSTSRLLLNVVLLFALLGLIPDSAELWAMKSYSAPVSNEPPPHTIYLPIVAMKRSPSVSIVVIPGESASLSLLENKLRLIVPAGAISTETTFNLRQTSDRTIPDYQDVGTFFTLSAFDEQGQSITQFQRELGFAIRYDGSAVLDEGQLALYRSTDGVNWQKVTSTIDRAAKQIYAWANTTGQFALLSPTEDPLPYEVGVGPGVPAHVTDAFRAAYRRNGGESKIGLPHNEVHDWAGAWIQDFDWASIIYNKNKGTAYYIQDEYISKYVNAGGPSSYLALPVSDRFDPPEDALLLDKHTNFMDWTFDKAKLSPTWVGMKMNLYN